MSTGLVAVDTSALVAIAMREPGHELVGASLDAAERVGLSAPSLLETHMVLRTKLGDDADLVVRALLARYLIEIVPFGAAEAEIARVAFDLYGKGRHPARLNFGDCLSYALAKSSEIPLVFIGDDFSLTDAARG